jgi:hypothetical protein
MSVTTDLLLDIATGGNNYKIGKPWRFSEFSLVAVIPITRVAELPRAYRLLSEVRDKVRIKDTGDIHKMELVNKSDLPVLLKAGEILAGATQERTFTTSQFIMSGEKLVADVVCVHSSEGIRAGQQVTSEEFCPTSVRRVVANNVYPLYGTSGIGYTMTAGIQSEVWGGIKLHSSYTAQASSDFAGYLADSDPTSAPISTSWTTPSDDLYGRVRESEKKFEAVIKKVPKVENQVGLCLVTLEGFDALDLFNHPDSWDAIRERIVKAEAGSIANISDKGGLFEYRPEKAQQILKELLGSKMEESNIVEKENTFTTLIENEKVKGEVVTLYDQPIHLSLLRKG